MGDAIQLTWPEVARVKDALISVEKIMGDCNFANLELKTGLKVTMDLQGIRIEGSIKTYDPDKHDKPLKEEGK